MESNPLRPDGKDTVTTLNRGLLLEITTALETKLDDRQVVNDIGKLFVPDGTLEQLLDEKTVRHALLELPIFRSKLLGSTEEYAHKFCNQNPPFRKIFALLLSTGMSEVIIPFVDLGINDLALPMPDPRLPLSYEPLGSSNDRRVDDWNKWISLADSWLKRSCLNNIHVRQWCLLTPHFSRQDSIVHYTFSHNHVLPFLQNDFTSLNHSIYQTL